jgi:NitT/TauT family transport system permease protein
VQPSNAPVAAGVVAAGTVPSAPDPVPKARGRRRRSGSRGALTAKGQAIATAAILFTLLVIWAIGSETGTWSAAVLAPPDEAFGAVVEMVQTSIFWEAFKTTAIEIVATFFSALIIGFGLGFLFWKIPYLGKVCEPYLVSFYAVPFIVFYPICVVLIGLNSVPIIVLATIMALIPMTLNTWIGLSGVRPVFWKLAASLECSPTDTIFKIAIPAAAPIIMAGVRLAMIYSLIGSVSMEFLLAPNGLGFQIRYQYELFRQDAMIGYVLVVFALAGMMAVTISLMETRILGRRSAS